MSYWAAARLEPRREQLALQCLALNGYTTYFPRILERRVSRGRKIEVRPPLFPGYCFVSIELQWHAARWCPSIVGLCMDGVRPAHVPDAIIAEIRGRERGGYVVLPRPPKPLPPFQPGAQVRVARGLLSGCLGIYNGMRGSERVEVLLAVLGKVMLAKGDVEAM
jgi:transcription antitermination factor NusG